MIDAFIDKVPFASFGTRRVWIYKIKKKNTPSPDERTTTESKANNHTSKVSEVVLYPVNRPFGGFYFFEQNVCLFLLYEHEILSRYILYKKKQ